MEGADGSQPTYSNEKTCCIYFKPPSEKSTFEDLTRDTLKEWVNTGRLIGKPIRFEHIEEGDHGVITKSFLGKDGITPFVSFKIRTDTVMGSWLAKNVEEKVIRGVSLSHNWKSVEPIEVSLCAKGRRPNTFIVQCTDASESERAEYSMLAEAKSVSPILYTSPWLSRHEDSSSDSDDDMSSTVAASGTTDSTAGPPAASGLSAVPPASTFAAATPSAPTPSAPPQQQQQQQQEQQQQPAHAGKRKVPGQSRFQAEEEELLMQPDKGVKLLDGAFSQIENQVRTRTNGAPVPSAPPQQQQQQQSGSGVSRDQEFESMQRELRAMREQKDASDAMARRLQEDKMRIERERKAESDRKLAKQLQMIQGALKKLKDPKLERQYEEVARELPSMSPVAQFSALKLYKTMLDGLVNSNTRPYSSSSSSSSSSSTPASTPAPESKQESRVAASSSSSGQERMTREQFESKHGSFSEAHSRALRRDEYRGTDSEGRMPTKEEYARAEARRVAGVVRCSDLDTPLAMMTNNTFLIQTMLANHARDYGDRISKHADGSIDWRFKSSGSSREATEEVAPPASAFAASSPSALVQASSMSGRKAVRAGGRY